MKRGFSVYDPNCMFLSGVNIVANSYSVRQAAILTSKDVMEYAPSSLLVFAAHDEISLLLPNLHEMNQTFCTYHSIVHYFEEFANAL